MAESREVWIVGRHHGEDKAWEFMGAFSSRDLAIAACTRWEDFAASAVLDERLPDDPVEWKDLVYPLADAQADGNSRGIGGPA